MRQTHKLSDAEIRAVRNLPDVAGVALNWWRLKAQSLGLDPASLLMCDTGWRFTGLPLGHGKPWCYPIELKCRYQPPMEVEVKEAKNG